MSTLNPAFGQRLKHHRLERGITLEAIAASTKINKALLEELERGDPAHWPHGIFRRSFIRAYATAIGLPAEETLREFLRYYPDEGGGATSSAAVQTVELRRKPSQTSETNVGPCAAHEAVLRITLAPGSGLARERLKERLVDAACTLGAIAGAGTALSLLAGMSAISAAGVVALLWYPAATIAAGDTSVRRASRAVASTTQHAWTRLRRRRPTLRAVPRQERPGIPVPARDADNDTRHIYAAR